MCIYIYIYIIEKRIIFKTKTGYYLELLKPETTKLLESNEKKINKNKSGENFPYRVLCQMCKITLNISLKTRKKNC